MDARALAHIARLIAAGQTVQGCKPYMHVHSIATHNLRLLVNERRRMVKTSTRRLNQLDQLGHSIWPELIQNKKQWLNCLSAGAVTPDDIRDLLAGQRPDDTHPTAWLWMKRKLSDLPAINAEPRIVQTVRRLYDDYSRLQQSIIRIKDEISQEIEREPFAEVTAVWRTVPTINDIRIAAFHVATNGQADQYTRAQFKSAVGWAAITKTSGQSDDTRRSRAGYKPAMDAIHHMTYSLLNGSHYPGNPIYEYKARGKSMAACRRKLAGILSGIARSKTECRF
jgi:predicted DNA-binding protein (MmcQ/YjbR family)